MKDIRGSIYNVKRHVKSTFHKQNVQAMKCTVAVDQFVQTPEVQKKQLFDDSVKDAESRLAGLVAKEDISIRKTDSLLQVMESCFPNDAVGEALASSRTKTTGIIKNFLAIEEKVQLANWLRNNKFAIIVDESTDKSWAKVLVIIAKCVDANYNVREDFLGLIDVHDASSAGQKNLIMKCLSDLGIPIQNLMGIGLDNASVNAGSVKGLGVLLKEEVPNLFILGCTSHSLALCATYAAKNLSEGLEVFIHDIVNYIASSPKHQDELKKCQEFVRINKNDYKYETLVNLRCIDPTVPVSGKVDTIVSLMICFPSLLGDSEGESDTLRDKLEVQWTKLADIKLVRKHSLNMSKKVQEDVLHCRSRSLYSKRAAYAAQGKIDLDKNGCLESER
ncbi:hypothetical protein QYM36_005047 [Artemia franciscana]|uniref:DUF4371 domain-containing protein n=1 Tax=Artemia franciscana TaxID=6661 RepID=A0AA88I3F1_ARTSF|nr:hypothetical protein QYM36_005047 [Artemia franciscana]